MGTTSHLAGTLQSTFFIHSICEILHISIKCYYVFHFPVVMLLCLNYHKSNSTLMVHQWKKWPWHLSTRNTSFCTCVICHACDDYILFLIDYPSSPWSVQYCWWKRIKDDTWEILYCQINVTMHSGFCTDLKLHKSWHISHILILTWCFKDCFRRGPKPNDWLIRASNSILELPKSTKQKNGIQQLALAVKEFLSLLLWPIIQYAEGGGATVVNRPPVNFSQQVGWNPQTVSH